MKTYTNNNPHQVRRPDVTGKGKNKTAPRRKPAGNDSLFANPWKFFLILIPVVILFITGSILMGVSETSPIVLWFMTLMLIGIAAYPLSAWLFKTNGSGGFFLSQPLGLILAGLIVWTLSYIKIFRFNLLCIIIALVAIAAVSYGVKPLRDNLIERLKTPGTFYRAVGEQTVFAVIFVVLCYFKGYGPMINGQEKFMDYGFIMSMLRNSKLPASDMWLSGKSINYYYFGQYLYAFLIKLSNVKTGVGYNLAMCSAIAIPFTMAYSIGCMLIDSAREFGLRCGKVMTQVCGILAGFTVMIFGNSHSFFYDEDSFGHRFLKLFDKMGFDVGRNSYNDPEYYFFYPDSTRYIGYNPDTAETAKGGGDYTIEEFPFYSYLVGDLHAHVVSTMVVLLIMAVCIAMITRKIVTADSTYTSSISFSNFSPKNGTLTTAYKTFINVELITIAVLLGCAQMTNYWDFLIYFIFSSMTLLVYHTRYSSRFSTIAGVIGFGATIAGILGVYLAVGSSPVVHFLLQALVLVFAYACVVATPCALTKVSAGMSFIFTVSTLTALPFNYHFDMISNALGKVKNNTPIYQLYILWGTHAIICITFFIITMVSKNYEYLSVARKRKKNRNTSEAVIGERGTNPISNFLAERNIIDFFVCGMVAVGFLLIIAPEIFYVRDIYTGGYLRANTMFKFCYAAFIILSMSVAYAVVRLFWLVSKKGEYSNGSYACAIFFCILLLVPAHYSYESLDQRCGLEDGNSEFITLDGTKYLDTYHSPWLDHIEGVNMLSYRNAIDWFNSEVSGYHVIMEACGDSYTDYNMISAYTGLPTVRGWLVHEWLWRFHGIVDKEQDLLIDDPDHSVWDVLDPRTNAVRDVYSLNYDAASIHSRAEEIAWARANDDYVNGVRDDKTPSELFDEYYDDSYEAALNEFKSNIQSKLDLYGCTYDLDPNDQASVEGAIRAIMQAVFTEYDVEYVVIGDLEKYCYGNDNTDLIASLGEIVFTDVGLTIVKVTP